MGNITPACGQTPTPAQLEILKTLPPEQQRALLEQATKSGAMQSDRVVEPPLDVPDTQRPKERAEDAGIAPNTLLGPEGADLKPFGYDIFANVPTTFAPATDIPVPAEYVLGPGDTIEVQLIGEGGGRYSLTVSRDGKVDFPNLGPIAVAGLRFPAAKDLLEKSVAEQTIGMRASISMGGLRSIRIFVLGEAERPGSYTVSGLSTITNALLASGGVKPIGSLRNIQLKRQGHVVSHVDLYDLLLRGDTGADVRLLPGDVIFIPPVGTMVGIGGEVRRPAIYELQDGAKVAEIVSLAGGLTPRADPRTARINRIADSRNRTIVNVDLSGEQGRQRLLQAGDVVRIQPIRESMEGAVQLLGNVYRERQEEFRPGMRLTDLVQSLDEVRALTDMHYVLIRRENGPDRRVDVLSADLAAAFAGLDSSANVPLQARDRVYVFDLATSRQAVIKPILEDLLRQSGRNQPMSSVGVGGQVKVAGNYPFEPGMKISDLLRAAGGLDQAAYGGAAELVRYEVVEGERRQTEVIDLDLAHVLAGNLAADIALRPFDHLVVKQVPHWREQEKIAIRGEVRFPGIYPIKRGETLKAVLARAGGLTDDAFAEGSVFTRGELREREQRQLQELADRLQRELAALSLQTAQSTDKEGNAQAAASAGQAMLADLNATKAVGRLVIDLDEVVRTADGGETNVIVRDGDELVVPRHTESVTVLGEVQGATSHVYRRGLSPRDYIDLSGGFTPRADEKHVFVIRANGEVETVAGSAWRGRGARDMHPGDTVIAPLNAQQMRPLTAWTSVTQILYNIAVAVAAVNSF